MHTAYIANAARPRFQYGRGFAGASEAKFMSGYTMVGLIAFIFCMITMVMFGAFLGRVLEVWAG